MDGGNFIGLIRPDQPTPSVSASRAALRSLAVFALLLMAQMGAVFLLRHFGVHAWPPETLAAIGP